MADTLWRFSDYTVGDAPGGLRIFVIYKIQSELVRTFVDSLWIGTRGTPQSRLYWQVQLIELARCSVDAD
jgi:hypothetical protein